MQAGWILEISRILPGAIGWPAYLASRVCVASAFVLVFTDYDIVRTDDICCHCSHVAGKWDPPMDAGLHAA